MAARTVAKDIITICGSATIVSEFFGIHIIFLFSRFPPISLIFAYLCIFCELLPDLFFGDFVFSFLGICVKWALVDLRAIV